MARRFTATPAYAVVTLVCESVSKRISVIRKSFILSHSQVDVRANSTVSIEQALRVPFFFAVLRSGVVMRAPLKSFVDMKQVFAETRSKTKLVPE